MCINSWVSHFTTPWLNKKSLYTRKGNYHAPCFFLLTPYVFIKLHGVVFYTRKYITLLIYHCNVLLTTILVRAAITGSVHSLENICFSFRSGRYLRHI